MQILGQTVLEHARLNEQVGPDDRDDVATVNLVEQFWPSVLGLGVDKGGNLREETGFFHMIKRLNRCYVANLAIKNENDYQISKIIK